MTDNTITRIAIPCELPSGFDAQRAGRFGRCACFTLVDVAGEEVERGGGAAERAATEGGCMAPVLVLASAT